MIHHYTSIKTLGLILKYKTIKFTRTDLVNDPLEGFSDSFEHYRKLSYITCFTKRDDDSIPMWAMYTENFKGVRISFPETLFGEVEQNRFGLKIRNIKQNPLRQESPFLAGPEDIEYKDTLEEINHEVITVMEKRRLNGVLRSIKFNPWNVGKYKLKDWEFEKECRFIIPAIDHMFVTGEDRFEERIEEIVAKLDKLDTEIYININENVLTNAEILLGPKADKAEEILVEAIVKAFAPNIKKISKSKKLIN